MRKTQLALLLLVPTLALLSGCSTTRESASGPASSPPLRKEVASKAPMVLNVRTEPGTFELNRDLQPIRPAEVFAEVEALGAPVTQVNLRFPEQGIEIPMQKVEGVAGLWRAELDPKHLEVLAVSGQTVQYAARVVARDANGAESRSQPNLQVAVRTPDLANGDFG